MAHCKVCVAHPHFITVAGNFSPKAEYQADKDCWVHPIIEGTGKSTLIMFCGHDYERGRAYRKRMELLKLKTQEEARKDGYTIDTCCNPPIGYKGPRFAPTALVECFTDLESELLEALEGIIEIGKRDLTNPKYDGYFESAKAAIRKARGQR